MNEILLKFSSLKFSFEWLNVILYMPRYSSPLITSIKGQSHQSCQKMKEIWKVVLKLSCEYKSAAGGGGVRIGTKT